MSGFIIGLILGSVFALIIFIISIIYLLREDKLGE